MLPLELWSSTCRFLDQNDLAKVARTSSQLSAAARPILYQSIHLRNDRDGFQTTFKILKSDHSLARNVRDIHIFTTWRRDGKELESWLDLGAFSNLVQLRSITMTASPFQNAEDQNTFLTTVKKSCPLLKNFTYKQGLSPPTFIGLYPTKFPSSNFCIAGIEKLIWDDESCLLVAQPQLFSLMRGSLQTIVHLSILSELDDFGIVEAVPFFRNIRFPLLRVFKLGNWFDDDGPVVLTEFLVAHPTIQDLVLDWDDGSEHTSELSDDAVTPDMLPNLRSLRSHAYNMLILLRVDVHFLGNLEKLSVGHGLPPEAEHQIDEMLDGLIARGGLPRLKSLHFDPEEGCTDLEDLQTWMSQWFRICPGLHKWSGFLADTSSMGLDALISSFANFSRLTRIELSYTILRRGVEDVILIASRLPSLRKVTICPAELAGLRDGPHTIRRATYHIRRNDLGAVSQLTIRKYSIYNKVTTIYHNIAF